MERERRITQEFYCGECDGYFMVRLNEAINCEVLIVCPNCQHEHQRCIKDGRIYEQGRFQSKVKEEIMPTKTTYSKTAVSHRMQHAHETRSYRGRRDGVPLIDVELQSLWIQTATRERGEDD